MRPIRMLATVGAVVAVPGLAAAEFDGSRPLLCSTTEVLECTEDAACVVIPRQSVGVPQFLQVDVTAREIWDARLGREAGQSAIALSEMIDGKLILQGTDPGVEQLRDGLGWTVTIDQTDGSYVLTAASADTGYVLFGACVPAALP